MALDEADVKKITEIMTAGFATLKTEIHDETTKMVSGAVNRVKSEVTENLLTPDAVKKIVTEVVKPGEPEKKKKGGEAESEDVVKLRDELGAVTKRLEAEAKARAELQAKTRRETERTQLREALKSAGVPEFQILPLAALLHTENQRIETAEDGSVRWVSPDGVGGKAYVDLKEGVNKFLSSEEGKAYLPPKNIKGPSSKDNGGDPAQGGGSHIDAREFFRNPANLNMALRGTDELT